MDMNIAFLGAGLAIGGAGFGVALGQADLTRMSLDILGRNPKLSPVLLVYTILGVALVESAAIYALIIAFQIISLADTLDPARAIAAGLAIGLSGLGVGYGQGKIVANALDAVNRNPENKNQVLQFMILFLALVETAAIYGLIISFQLLG